MSKRLLSVLPAVVFAIALKAQTIALSIPDTTAQTGDTLLLPITAAGFDEVVSMQFSIQWNPAVISYVNFEMGDLSGVAIGETTAAQGTLRLSWFDVEGLGVTRPDGVRIVRLRFVAIGSEGSFTPVAITDDPLPVQIFRVGSTPEIFDPLTLEQDTGSVTIIGLWQPVVADIQGPPCFGESTGAISLSIAGAPAGAVFNWSGPGGFSSQAPSLSGIPAGTYTLRVESAQGILLYETEVTVPEPQELLITGIVAVPAGCGPGGGSVTVQVTGGVPPYTYQLDGNGQPDSVFTNLPAGQYALVVSDSAGCKATGTVLIGEATPPTPDLGEDVVLCPGEHVLLTVGDFAAYLWSDGSTGATLLVSQSGIYSVTVTDAQGCAGADSVTVEVSETVEIVVENLNLSICPGDSLQLLVSGGSDYRWIDTSGTLSRTDVFNPIARPASSTTYTVIVSTACATDTASVFVRVHEVTAMAGPDTCVNRGAPVRLSASGGVSYFWLSSEYPLSSFTSPNPTTTPLRSTVFQVLIVDVNGCETLLDVPVSVLDGVPDILLVNVITPNGDGKNDLLEFRDLEKFINNSLKVYNRWGDLIYQKLGYQTDSERFDGTYKGKPLPAGNYFYILSFAETDFKQTLTIVRD
jgi:gliding motility-associated-like protein